MLYKRDVYEVYKQSSWNAHSPFVVVTDDWKWSKETDSSHIKQEFVYYAISFLMVA